MAKPCLLARDFNSPLNLEDKYRWKINLSRSIEYLRKFVKQTQLKDLPLKGIKFTWTNKQCGKNFIQRRLDRMMEIGEWIKEFQNFDLYSLPRIAFAHKPLILILE